MSGTEYRPNTAGIASASQRIDGALVATAQRQQAVAKTASKGLYVAIQMEQVRELTNR